MPGRSRLWVVTSYFNPMGFRTRRENYRAFRSRLGLPLVAVEFGVSDRFDLAPGDAEILVQLRGRDVIWQKERLLNVALGRLPPECDIVAWLDCDVVLEDRGWPEKAARALETRALIQPHGRVVHLRRGEVPETAEPPAEDALRRSFCHAWTAGSLPADIFLRPEATSEERCSCGMAWAARRDLLDRHGLYDTMILGMGDKHIAAAAVGRAEDGIACLEMSPRHADQYRRWAAGFHRDVQGRVGCLDGTLYHLWHGDLADRRYVERYEGFRALGFDPGAHLVLDPEGFWRFGPGTAALRRRAESFFEHRHEDGRDESAALLPAELRA